MISTVLVVIVVVVALLLVGARLFGLQVYAVLSGSMEPTYHVGSVIYVEPVDPSEIQVGDPITFVMNEELTVATHRVVRIDAENSLSISAASPLVSFASIMHSARSASECEP